MPTPSFALAALERRAIPATRGATQRAVHVLDKTVPSAMLRTPANVAPPPSRRYVDDLANAYRANSGLLEQGERDLAGRVRAGAPGALEGARTLHAPGRTHPAPFVSPYRETGSLSRPTTPAALAAHEHRLSGGIANEGDPDEGLDVVHRMMTPRREVALTANGGLSPDHLRELERRTLIPHNPDVARPSFPTDVRDFSDPLRGGRYAVGGPEHATAQFIAEARRKYDAVPRAIAPKTAGMRAALARYGVSPLLTLPFERRRAP